jgi:ATP-dependent DNA helicase HFM1/MER3
MDDKLLQQPNANRQQQAALGRTRLSLAPGPSTFFSNPPPTYMPQSQRNCHDDTYDDQGN